MVHVANGTGAKGLAERLKELQAHRKMQHRSFTRFADGDTYTVLMFAHDAAGELLVVFANCAMPQLKEVLPIELFKQSFEQQVEATQPIIKRQQANGQTTP